MSRGYYVLLDAILKQEPLMQAQAQYIHQQLLSSPVYEWEPCICKLHNPPVTLQYTSPPFQLTHTFKLENSTQLPQLTFVFPPPFFHSITTSKFNYFIMLFFVMSHYITYIDHHPINPLPWWEKHSPFQFIASAKKKKVVQQNLHTPSFLQIKCLSEPLPTNVNS